MGDTFWLVFWLVIFVLIVAPDPPRRDQW